jgi:ABC-type sugar transport system permease subunit
MLFGLFLALLAQKRHRLSFIYETIYAIPMAISTAIIAIVFQLALNPTLGIINKVFKTNINWLYDQQTAFLSLVIIQIWLNLGFSFLFLLVALRNIPPVLLETCALDGASRRQEVLFVTIPLISPTVFFLLISTTAHSMVAGGLTIILTQGGPNGSTEMIVSYIYRQAILNQNYNNGYTATSLGYMLSFIIIFANFIYEKRLINYD